jgi:1-acyl-sn-glycerol-3-phosphate acyltransferase
MSLAQWLRFLAMFPALYTSARQQKNTSFLERWSTLQGFCRLFFVKMKRTYRVINRQSTLPPVAYYVSNHQGTFDPVLLLAAIDQPLTFISKAENLKLPVIGTWGRLIEFITFKRESYDDNVGMLRQAARVLKEGRSLLIFPEGTRSKSNDTLPFKPGALLPAYLAKVPIIPVTQIHTHELDQTGKWRHTLAVILDEPIPYETYKPMAYADLALKLQTQIDQNIKARTT